MSIWGWNCWCCRWVGVLWSCALGGCSNSYKQVVQATNWDNCYSCHKCVDLFGSCLDISWYQYTIILCCFCLSQVWLHAFSGTEQWVVIELLYNNFVLWIVEQPTSLYKGLCSTKLYMLAYIGISNKSDEKWTQCQLLYWKSLSIICCATTGQEKFCVFWSCSQSENCTKDFIQFFNKTHIYTSTRVQWYKTFLWQLLSSYNFT